MNLFPTPRLKLACQAHWWFNQATSNPSCHVCVPSFLCFPGCGWTARHQGGHRRHWQICKPPLIALALPRGVPASVLRVRGAAGGGVQRQHHTVLPFTLPPLPRRCDMEASGSSPLLPTAVMRTQGHRRGQPQTSPRRWGQRPLRWVQLELLLLALGQFCFDFDF